MDCLLRSYGIELKFCVANFGRRSFSIRYESLHFLLEALDSTANGRTGSEIGVEPIEEIARYDPSSYE